MTGINESAPPSLMSAALMAGIDSLDLEKIITFQAYSRVVLPIDGYVFWSPTVMLQVSGSLHYSQDIVQSEDELYGVANVIFTAEQKVTEFEAMPINTIYVGTIGKFRFAFRAQQGFYTQAGIWHYIGASIAPAMLTQLLDAPSSLDVNQAVVSNSLPLWLVLNGYKNPYFDGFSNPSLILYPSFISPPNQAAPYATVHIGDGEGDTEAVQSAPVLTRDRSHYQLMSERVRITLYGLQNDAAMDFVDCVNQYSVDTNNFGIMNMPVMRDSKRKQEELQALGMKKVIDYRISYNQSRVADIGRQLILDALPIRYIFEGSAKPPPQPPPFMSALITNTGEFIQTDDGLNILVD